MPAAIGFAAGAMMWVVLAELLPEALDGREFASDFVKAA